MNAELEQSTEQLKQSITEAIPRQTGKVALSGAEVVLEHPAEDNPRIVLSYN